MTNHFDEGCRLYREKKYAEALREYRSAAASEPDNERVYLEIGRVLREKGEYRKASEALIKAEEISSDKNIADILSERGRLAEDLNNREEACRLYLESYEASREAGLIQDAARTLEGLNRLKEAAALLEKASEDHPEDTEILYSAGQAYYKISETDKALRFFNLAAESSGNCSTLVAALKGAARVYEERKEYEVSEKLYLRVLALDSKDTDAVKALGRLYEEMGAAGRALEHYLTAHKLSDSDPDILKSVGNIYINKNKYESAEHYLRKALAQDPADPITHLRLGEIRRELGDNNGALEFFTHAAAYSEDKRGVLRKALENSARLNEKTGDYPEAMNTLKKLISEYPRDSLILTDMGRVSEKLNEKENALGYFKSALEAGASFEIYKDIGCIQMERENYSGAVISFKKALEDQPDSGELEYLTAEAYYASGNCSEAEERFRKASLSASSAEDIKVRALKGLASIYEKRETYNESLESYLKAQRLKPDDIEIVKGLGRLSEKSGDKEKALEYYQMALIKGDNSAELLRDIASIYRCLGEDSKAVETLSAALKLSGVPATTAGIYLEQARLLEAQGKYSEALESFKKASKMGLSGANSSHTDIGRMMMRTGDFKGAEDEFNKALASEEDNSEAYSELGRIYYKRGDLKRTVEAFIKCRENSEENRFMLADSLKKLNRIRESIEVYDRISASSPTLSVRNSALNSREILERKIELSSKPRMINITLTNRCNINCSMCGYPGEKKKDLPDEVIDKILKWTPYLEKILWQGGEVFLSERFSELFEKAAASGVSQLIVSNGMLIDDDWIDKITNSKCDLAISVDGFEKEKYESIRQGASFEKLTALLEKMRMKKKNSDMRLILQMVVMSENYGELEKLSGFAKKYGFDQVRLKALIDSEGKISSIYSSEKYGNDIALLLGRLRKELEEDSIELVSELPLQPILDIQDNTAETGDSLSLATPTSELEHDKLKSVRDITIESITETGEKAFLGESDTSSEDNESAPEPVCLWPWQHMVIYADGRVAVCCQSPRLIIGDANTQSLDEIWNGVAVKKLRKCIINQDKHPLCASTCFSGDLNPEALGLR